jgi:hypothetical protein
MFFVSSLVSLELLGEVSEIVVGGSISYLNIVAISLLKRDESLSSLNFSSKKSN